MHAKPIPPPPKTQALSTTTFFPPRLDGSMTIVEMFEWHLIHSKDHRLFIFQKDNGDIRTIYWPEAVHAIHVGTRIVKEKLGNVEDGCVIALLTPSDTISYFCMIMAILRANHIPFPISPRNSAQAVAHLTSKVDVRLILRGRDNAMLSLAEEAIDILKKSSPNAAVPDISPVPIFEDLFTGETPDMSDIPLTRQDPDGVAFYLHSSGSTAFPKPIPWTNYRFCQLSLDPYFGGQDLTNLVWGMHTMPMFHGMGVSQIGYAATAGTVLSTFEPKYPPVAPTPDALYKAAVAAQSDIIFCVPTFIEAWSRNPEYVKWLATRNGVLYGGGPLNKTAGDYMASQGVSIYILYGFTEAGIMSPVVPANGSVGYDWDYFKFPDSINAEMVPQGGNTYEFVVVPGPHCEPCVFNTKFNGVDAYATSDLFTPHPTKPGYWKIYGRLDDQIMHSTGEKTNPGPLESILNQDPHVASSVMFGRGHFQAGVIIDPKLAYRFDPKDENKLAEFRNSIWPTVKRMNEYAPQHSRIFKEMILVANPSKPFTYTGKNTARRQAIIIDYADEIETLYKTVEASTQSAIPPPDRWDIISATEFVRSVVNSVLVHTVGDEDDVFQNSCDSLQATWIRNSLLRALQDSAHLETRNSPENFVYDHPTILSLSKYIVDVACGIHTQTLSSNTPQDKVAAVQAMVSKYARDFPTVNKLNSGSSTQGVSVLVTGTTGALGCYILASLVENKFVDRIYALNRHKKDGPGILERQENALVERGLDPSILADDKVSLVEANLSVPGFGIPSHVYNEIRESVTHIIHNAWTVDFNLSLISFENNIKGLRNLIDFALSSPHEDPVKFMYSSSIGIFQNLPDMTTAVSEDTPVTPETAIGNGYTESKWISEQILAEASKKTPLSPLVVRVGQLSGGINGCWNKHEWFPALVQSSTVMGCVPDEHKAVSWIPVDIAAKAIVDFLSSDFKDFRTVHLTHPNPISWNTIAQAVSAELNVSLVPVSGWFQKLEELGHQSKMHGSDLVKTVPALRLLPFFRKLCKGAENSTSKEAMGFANLENKAAVEISKTLADGDGVGRLAEEDVRRWIGYWRRVGLLSKE